MSSIRDTAERFFDACETGKGWRDCKQVEADYVYVMSFDDGRIRHLRKIWNDAHSLKQLGWM